MFQKIRMYCDNLKSEFSHIPQERKRLLEKLADYIKSKNSAGKSVKQVYICTHNSRRSHFGQIWAKVASDYYQIPDIQTYSGGTVATAFHSNAINALVRIGFIIKPINFDKNTTYQVTYDDAKPSIECFSKTYDHFKNPRNEFVAIMTCSEAEENCPFIPGADLRIGTTYDDPKAFDNTPQQDVKYDERCRQIARETLYVFSKVKT
jgi:arsenate reductase (thioredoxin)